MLELELQSPSRTGTRCLKAICKLISLALLLVLPSVAQNNGLPPIPRGGMQHSADRTQSDDGGDPGDLIWQERQLRALNADRQRELVKDTNKLLKLARELDAEIGSTNPDSLTSDQIRRIEEIEKLARSVKEKMSTCVNGLPMYQLDAPVRMR